MNPLEHLLDIEARLAAGSVDVDQALTELTSRPKSWRTSWWKAERKQRLAESCAACGSATPPLVLQHTWHPVKWRDAIRRVEAPDWEWWKEQHPVPDKSEIPLVQTERPVCPTCSSTRMTFRKRTKDWVCQAGQYGQPHERHEACVFAEPRLELRLAPNALRDRNRRYEAILDKRWQGWLASSEYQSRRRRALQLCIEESKRYLSFSDTKTLCKRCAAREDFEYIRMWERGDERSIPELPTWEPEDGQ